MIPSNVVLLDHVGLSKYGVTLDGDIWSVRQNKFMAKVVHRDGYLFVRLIADDGIHRNYYVHRLVCMAFNPVPNMNQLQVDHIDGNKMNNNIANLRWIDNLGNAHAAMKLGLMPHAVFRSDDDVRQICEYLSNGMGCTAIANITGYPATAIEAIKYRRNWTHISKDYKFPQNRCRTLTSEEDVRKICELYCKGYDLTAISKITGIDRVLVRRICNGTNYRRISSEYFDL